MLLRDTRERYVISIRWPPLRCAMIRCCRYFIAADALLRAAYATLRCYAAMMPRERARRTHVAVSAAEAATLLPPYAIRCRCRHTPRFRCCR